MATEIFRKKRVMQITHDLDIGGLQQVVVNICRTIDRKRFDVSVLCLRKLGVFVPEVEEMGIKVFFLPQRQKGTDYFSFLKVAKILRRETIEVIHTHNTQPFIDGTLGALMSGVRAIVHTDHARDFPDKRRYMFAEWLMSHFAYRVVGVSDHTSQNLVRHERISPPKVMTIVNGIDGSKYDIKIDKDKKKKELGLTNRGLIIGLGVRLTEQKGITYLLRAMTEVNKVFPDITLVIAGEGPLEDELKRESALLGIDQNVLFAGPRLDMPELLKLFDIYVLPSLWEGLPMVLLEAMAAACPVIATKVGGVSTVIKHGRNGSLIEAKNQRELASEIIKLLEDKHLRAQYSREGERIFRAKFTAETMTRKYEQLYLQKI